MKSFLIFIFVLAVAVIAYFSYFSKAHSPNVGVPETVVPTPDTTSTTVTKPLSPKPSTSPLLGTEWGWDYTLYVNGTERKAPAGKFVIMFGADKNFASTTDCNNLSGKFIVDDEILSIGPIGATKMACPPGTLEAEYTQELSRATSHVITGNELRINLLKDTGTMVFTRRLKAVDPVPTPISLTGKTYRLASYNGAAVNGSYTLSFKATSLNAKFCNTMNGEYAVKDTVVKASSLVSTLMYCGTPANIMDIESAFGTLLNGGATAHEEGNVLTLTGSGTTMTFTKS